MQKESSRMKWVKRVRVTEDSTITAEEDRLSMLPDGLLIHILSFLVTKHAVETCVLSKRWINIWTSISSLTFNSIHFKNVPSFIKFIDRVLILRDDSVKVNCLNLSCTESFGRYISRHGDEYSLLPFPNLINYAKAHGVQDLNIFIKKCSTFSDFMYSCTSLMTFHQRINSLDINGCIENLKKTFCFEQLVTLSLGRVWLVESDPFAGCPNLEDLTLLDCSLGFSHCGLTISAPKLSRLIISSRSHEPWINDIVLSTPKLTSFNYHGCFPPLFSPNDLPLLNTVTVNLNRCMNEEKHGIDLINMLKGLHNAKSLILSGGTVQLLSAVPDKLALEASPIRNLKRLSFIIAKGGGSYNIPAHVMTYLLKDTPNAEVVLK